MDGEPGPGPVPESGSQLTPIVPAIADEPRKTIAGVIGLGEIGRGLASAIDKAGIPLAVHDVRTDAMRPFADRAHVCTDLAEIGSMSDVLVVAVVTDDQVLEVLDPSSGAAASMREGSTVVVVSTVRLETVRRLCDLLAVSGIGVVDCGVSGGASAAADGALVSMVGGSDTDVDRAAPVIDAFSSRVVRMGPPGAGQQAKLARNLIQFGAWLAAFEGQRLAEQAGIDLSKLAEVVKASDERIGGVSTLMFRSTTAPFGQSDDQGLVAAMESGASLAHKDLRAALDLGDELGVDLPLARLAQSHVDAVFGVGPLPAPAVTGSLPGRRPPAPDRGRGQQRMSEVYGFSADPDAGPGDFMAYTVDHLFGDVWSRQGLDVASRRLLTIGVLAASGLPDLLRVQFDAALANGELTDTQVREIVIHLAHYAGWPLAAGANNAAEAAIARRAEDDTRGSPRSS
ncbi:MAG TPA: NAD(P)-binding domain-containing protein [Acidimicrobiales bacterium]|nr:NAD(P)-binding domain-containing protein [Acidimicrobiales bacterium]